MPSYRVIVKDTRSKRGGSFIDIIGHYNPLDEKQGFTYDKKLFDEWVGKGAIVSDAVNKLIKGDYEYIKYVPKKQKSKEEDAEAVEAEVGEDPVKPADIGDESGADSEADSEEVKEE
jgi:small subunit ribosomal protein S16